MAFATEGKEERWQHVCFQWTRKGYVSQKILGQLPVAILFRESDPKSDFDSQSDPESDFERFVFDFDLDSKVTETRLKVILILIRR